MHNHVYSHESHLAPCCSVSSRNRFCNSLILLIACLCCLCNISFLWKVDDYRSPNDQKQHSLLFQNNSSVANKKDYPFTFSACLLVKDDIRILPEWLAYHYTVMPLRQLIVAIDPLSLTSPRYILEKFVKELPGMNITIWEDDDFRTNITVPNRGKPARPQDSVERIHEAHRYRQLLFYQKCLMELQKRNFSWTMLVDTDEYIVFNNYHENEGIHNSSRHKEVYNKMLSGEHLRANLPEVGKVTIAEYIAHNQGTTDDSLWTIYPCINMPRLYFSSKESATEEIMSQVPQGFDPLAFHTLRFRYHQHPRSKLSAGKSIVDASRYNYSWPKSVHKIMPHGCHDKNFPNYLQSPLRVHHYIGPLEFFLRKGQTMRGVENYKKRSDFVSGNYTNDDLRGWLKQFVSMVGNDTAVDLTERLKMWAITHYSNTLKEIELGSFTYPFYKNATND